MHVEIKVAQNFVLNFLYNKLPRRRVNLVTVPLIFFVFVADASAE